jgi:hypothetical protein
VDFVGIMMFVGGVFVFLGLMVAVGRSFTTACRQAKS